MNNYYLKINFKLILTIFAFCFICSCKIDGHPSDVTCIKYNSVEKYYASGDISGNLLLWDENFNIISKHNNKAAINDISISSTGSYIVTGSSSGEIIIWNKDSKKSKKFIGHASNITSIDISPNEKKIISCSIDGTYKIWSMNGEMLYENRLNKSKYITNYISKCLFISNDNKIILGINDGNIILINLFNNDKTINKIHSKEIIDVKYINTEKKYISYSQDDSFCLWDNKGNIYNRYIIIGVSCFDIS